MHSVLKGYFEDWTSDPKVFGASIQRFLAQSNSSKVPATGSSTARLSEFYKSWDPQAYEEGGRS